MNSSTQDILLRELLAQLHSPLSNSHCAAVCLRDDNKHFRVYPDSGGSTFRTAVSALNPYVAVKTRTSAIQAVLGDAELGARHVQIDRSTHIPIISSFADLSNVKGADYAALVRDEAVLIVWTESGDTIIPAYTDLEHRLRHVARLCHCSAVAEAIPSVEFTLSDEYSKLDGSLFDDELEGLDDAIYAVINWDDELTPLNELGDLHTIDFPDFLGMPSPDLSNDLAVDISQASLPRYGSEAETFDQFVGDYSPSPDTTSSSPFGVSPSLTICSLSSSSSDPSNEAYTPSTSSASSLSPSVTYSPAIMASPTLTLAPGSATLTSHKLESPEQGSPALYDDAIPVDVDPTDDGTDELVDINQQSQDFSPSPSEQAVPLSIEEPCSSPVSSVIPEIRRRGRPRGSGAKAVANTSLRTLIPARAVTVEEGPSSRRVGQKSKRSQRDDDSDQDNDLENDNFDDGEYDEHGSDENNDNEYVANAVASSSAKRVKTSSSSSVPSNGGTPKRAKARRKKSTTVKKPKVGCEKCGKTFVRATDLRRHSNTATCNGDTSTKHAHVCELCGKLITRFDAFRRHQKTVHKKEFGDS